MRKIIVTGRLVANAEINTTKNGNPYIEFRIANNERASGNGNSDNGNKDTYWFRVYSFNHTNLQPYLTKGKPIEVVGDLTASPYISNKTKKMEAGLEIKANDIMFDSNFGNQSQEQNEGTQAVKPASAPTDTATEVNKVSKPRNPSTATTIHPAPAPSATNDDSDDLPF